MQTEATKRDDARVSGETSEREPGGLAEANERDATRQATLGGGCFWCLEAVFSELRGVLGVVSGYAGGDVVNPSYEQVCRGGTGHAEVVQVTFDADAIAFESILDVFFAAHDPTTPNRQGADVGPQYRSLVLYHDEAQLATSQRVIERLTADGVWANPIVTELAPVATFYAAEAGHQEYYLRNRNQAYCRVVIEPKLTRMRAGFSDLQRGR